MYYCYECKSNFSKPSIFTETHGFAAPPFEHFIVCPACHSTNYSADERKKRFAK